MIPIAFPILEAFEIAGPGGYDAEFYRAWTSTRFRGDVFEAAYEFALVPGPRGTRVRVYRIPPLS